MDSEDACVLDALRRYLGDNPLACDSADGIARWWLRAAYAPRRVEAALQQLLSDGVLMRQSAADGRVRWKRSASPHAARP